MRISDWSSDACSSDLARAPPPDKALYSEDFPALGSPTNPKRSMRMARLPASVACPGMVFRRRDPVGPTDPLADLDPAAISAARRSDAVAAIAAARRSHPTIDLGSTSGWDRRFRYRLV